MRERLSDVRYCGVHSRATKHLASRPRAACLGFLCEVRATWPRSTLVVLA